MQPDEQQVYPGVLGHYRGLGGRLALHGPPPPKPRRRYCPCGNPLNSYNPGPDCNACKKAERDDLFGGDDDS